ncbi:MAG: hypothetical protein ACR2F8_05800 [Caulobacteraceae bacterium]
MRPSPPHPRPRAAGPAEADRPAGGLHTLAFPAFRAEIKKAFGADIPLKERADWESHLAENAAQVHALTAAIAAAEREIDAVVHELFDLTAEEVVLLEGSLAARY